MGRLFLQYLESDSNKGIYSCRKCAARGVPVHLALSDDIVSKSFHSLSGPAYLFGSAVNVSLGPAEERELLTGLHVVCDLHCTSCEQVVGWYYVKAMEERERYKEQKFILERGKILHAVFSSTVPFHSYTIASYSNAMMRSYEEPCEV